MQGMKKRAFKALKTVVDKDVNANDKVSSKCIAILYQPKRNVAKQSDSKILK